MAFSLGEKWLHVSICNVFGHLPAVFPSCLAGQVNTLNTNIEHGLQLKLVVHLQSFTPCILFMILEEPGFHHTGKSQTHMYLVRHMLCLFKVLPSGRILGTIKIQKHFWEYIFFSAFTRQTYIVISVIIMLLLCTV